MPRRYLRRLARRPTAHGLLREPRLFGRRYVTAKGSDDIMHHAHAGIVTDYRYCTQPPPAPILSDFRYALSRHIRDMDFSFDRALVKKAMGELRVTHQALAAAVGLTHKSAVPKILNGERAVKVGEAARIYSYLKLAPADSVSTFSVPIIGLASAGNWREAIDMPLGRVTVPSHVAGARAFAVEVTGDSMDVLIEDGGWIVIDPDDKALRAGKSYLIQNGEHEVTVKRYQSNPARFEPVSTNPEHEGFLASACDFIVLGRAVWKGERL